MGKKMTLMEKISFNFRKYFVNKSWRTNKYFRFIMILMSVIIISLIMSTNLKRDVYEKEPKITFDNFYKVSEVKEIQNKDLTGKEETTINLKAMFIGVIVFVFYFGLKKGAFGITLGTFLGATLGVWLALLFPSFFYFFELSWRWILKL